MSSIQSKVESPDFYLLNYKRCIDRRIDVCREKRMMSDVAGGGYSIQRFVAGR
jgi:hypothetical protein